MLSSPWIMTPVLGSLVLGKTGKILGRPEILYSAHGDQDPSQEAKSDLNLRGYLRL
jgi:hypothetical protein